MTRKRWSELSGRQQAAIVNFVGPLAYFTVGRRGGSMRAQGRR